VNEKSIVVEALTYQRDGYFPESPFYEKLDKAIRIAEIEHEIVQKVKHGASRDSLRELIEKHSEAFK
jgi:hypothetical protein